MNGFYGLFNGISVRLNGYTVGINEINCLNLFTLKVNSISWQRNVIKQ